jgi:hypothetical protein
MANVLRGRGVMRMAELSWNGSSGEVLDGCGHHNGAAVAGAGRHGDHADLAVNDAALTPL